MNDQQITILYIMEQAKEVRCCYCGKLLAKNTVFTQGYLEVKCGHCGKIVKIGLQ